MLERKINKEDINILNWAIISRKFKCLFEYHNSFYRAVFILDENLYLANNYANISFVKSYIVDKFEFIENVTLNDILNDEDRIMVSTDFFLKRINPYIKKFERNQKINQIIYGSEIKMVHN